MSIARHPRPPELEGISIEKIMKTHVARFSERDPDWEAFEDAKLKDTSGHSTDLSEVVGQVNIQIPKQFPRVPIHLV